MILKHGQLFDENFDLLEADLAVEGDRIASIGRELTGEEELDCTGCLILPGFVDVHIHGCVGADTCDGEEAAIRKMARHLLTKGVTSFCPTTMTVSPDEIRAALRAARGCMERPEEGARVLGVNMEGPFISVNKKGAQKAEHVRNPDWELFRSLYDDCGGIVRLVDVAPECEGAQELIAKAKELCTVSIAHTESDYDQAKQSFAWGITHATHLYNAMNGLTHRAPGVVGAVMDTPTVAAELICDGFHIHPAVLRITFRILGEDRTVVVSDSMRAAGQPDGDYDLGGQMVQVRGGHALLPDGTIAGSTTNLHDELKNLISFGIPLRHAVKSVTINPAREVGADGEVGSLAPGKLADAVVLDAQTYEIRYVMKDGRLAQL